MIVPRVEGRLRIKIDSEGRPRVCGEVPRHIERTLLGRAAADAVYLSQQISASNGVAHALCALRAWETVADTPVATNGALLRELLQLLALLHAHIHQFYFAALPDYLPLATMMHYEGQDPRATRLAAGLAALGKARWQGVDSRTKLRGTEQDRIIGRICTAAETLSVLQGLLAQLGGKYPIVMSLIPGGVTVSANPELLVNIAAGLGRIKPFVTEQALEDGLLLLDHYPEIRSLGWGGTNFLSTGLSVGGQQPREALFSSGVVLKGRVRAGTDEIDESIRHAYYRVVLNGDPLGRPVVPDIDKPGAYSWIKAPRVAGAATETGAVARLVIAREVGTHGRATEVADAVAKRVGVPLPQVNTVAGRMLARLGEMELIHQRAQQVLLDVEPNAPTREGASVQLAAQEASGEASATVEGPTGTVRHNMGLVDGRVVFYDIIGASTWNGSPLDRRDVPGPLELALGAGELSLDRAADRLTVSRIVHSFAFSASDAVH